MKCIGYISTSFNHKFNHMIQMCDFDLRLKILIEILQKLKQRKIPAAELKLFLLLVIFSLQVFVGKVRQLKY